MEKQRIKPAISGITKQNEVVKPQSSMHAFETKEEFIAHLIRTGEIQKDPHHPCNDGFIYLKGVLKIDKRVKRFLSWKDVIVTSAVVDSGMISKYQYLPKTYKGVTTNLKAPDLKSYMEHNNYGAKHTEDKWIIDDIFRISDDASHLDFSSVEVTNVTLFYGHQIQLSKLPYSKSILGLSPYSLGIDCPNPRKIAQQKGCGPEILKTLPPSNMFTDILGSFGSFFGSARR